MVIRLSNEDTFTFIRNEAEWLAYCAERWLGYHRGEPNKYPVLVHTNFIDNECNGPDVYEHLFVYSEHVQQMLEAFSVTP